MTGGYCKECGNYTQSINYKFYGLCLACYSKRSKERWKIEKEICEKEKKRMLKKSYVNVCKGCGVEVFSYQYLIDGLCYECYDKIEKEKNSDCTVTLSFYDNKDLRSHFEHWMKLIEKEKNSDKIKEETKMSYTSPFGRNYGYDYGYNYNDGMFYKIEEKQVPKIDKQIADKFKEELDIIGYDTPQINEIMLAYYKAICEVYVIE